jgi:predicted alpha-1,2-mannosidase
MMGMAALLASAGAAAQESKPLYRYVDPLIGVGNANEGDTIPGPTLPTGSIHPSPETLTGSNAGYDPNAPISGFAQLHTQGSGGLPSYGTFLVSPQTGVPSFVERDHLSPKVNERAGADAYAVTLTRYKTRVEVTPAHYAALYRFSFPAGQARNIVFDVTRKIHGDLGTAGAEVTLDPKTGTIIGRVRTKNYWQPTSVDIWFAAKLDQAPDGWGTVVGGVAKAGATGAVAAEDVPLGAYWSFAPTAKAVPVSMSIAVSFTSAERAAELLAQDMPNFDFDRVRGAAQATWNAALSKLTIDGVGGPDRRRFYTALAQSMVQPRDRTLDQPLVDRLAPLWDDHYTLWDTYRTAFPLMSLIRPRDEAATIASILSTFDRFGVADTAFIAGRNYHVGQGGDEVDNVLGEAFIRGLPGVDWRRAADVTRYNALERRRPRYQIQGWFAPGDRGPEFDHDRAQSGSSTLAFSLNDFYAAKLSAFAGRADEAAMLAKRSGSWRNVWNPRATSDGFNGFIIPRYADGRFQPLDPKAGWDVATGNHNDGFYEGTAWIYSNAVLHDVPGMIAAMGGRERFVARLQHSLGSGLIDYTNEPSFATPWLFDDVGRPDLASYWANAVFARFTANAYPGDEDAGAMSAHYVFNRIGLFPKLTTDLYYLHAPHQPRAELTLEGGKRFVILARKWAPGRVYIQSAILNGQPLTVPFVKQGAITAGGTLEVVLGDTPGTWGRTDLTNTKDSK